MNDKYITICQLAWNEEILIEFVHNWYKTRFPDARFILYDNLSTDKTVEIAKDLGYEVVQFDTGGKFNDITHQNIKNNVWRGFYTKWALLVDFDECVDINEQKLIEEAKKGTTIIKFEGYELIGNNTIDLKSMNKGVRNSRYDKRYLFDRESITSTRYDAGAHHALPLGTVKYSRNTYPAYHFKHLSEDYMVERYKLLDSRVDERNRALGHAKHYKQGEEQIRKEFKELQQKTIKLF